MPENNDNTSDNASRISDAIDTSDKTNNINAEIKESDKEAWKIALNQQIAKLETQLALAQTTMGNYSQQVKLLEQKISQIEADLENTLEEEAEKVVTVKMEQQKPAETVQATPMKLSPGQRFLKAILS